MVTERGVDHLNDRPIVNIPKSSTIDTMQSPPGSDVSKLDAGSISTNTNATSPLILSPSMNEGSLPSSLDHHLLSAARPLPLHKPPRGSMSGVHSPLGNGSPLLSPKAIPIGHNGTSVMIHTHAGSPGSGPYHSPSRRGSPASIPGLNGIGRRRYSNNSNGGISKSSPNASLLTSAPPVPSSLHDSSTLAYAPHYPNDHHKDAHSYRNTTGGPLNANSPLALAAAAQVTPDKLSRLLLTQGPLAIRHITSHLALTITGFADLSSSKQRRLIISALDSGDTVNSVIFEKISWGRWAARKLDHKPLSKEIRRQSISTAIHPPRSPVLKGLDAEFKDGNYMRRGSSNTGRSGLSSWAVDDVDLADDDMMFHNRQSRMDDDVAVVSDDEDDDDEDDSDDYGYANSSRTATGTGVFQSRKSTASTRQTGDTDDEDWQSLGAEGLRGNPIPIAKREQEAVDALVQLGSI